MKMSSTLQHWLIRRAARSAPGALAARLEEEWLADLAARLSSFSRLRFALGCCWATQVIALENRPARVSVVSAAVGARQGMLLPNAFSRLSRPSSTFLFVVAFHAALFYLVLTAVTRSHHVATPSSLQNQVLNIPRPVEIPRTDFQPAHNVRFEFPLTTSQLPQTVLITDDEPVGDLPPPSQSNDGPQGESEFPLQRPPHVISTIQGGPGAGFPNPDDFYPASAKRLNEEGRTTLKVCVDAKGRLISDPITTESSGSVRLDQGAIKLATSASGHYRATTEDGRQVSACYPLRIRFQIKN